MNPLLGLLEPTREQTAKRAIKVLRAGGVDASAISYDEEGFRLLVDGQHIFLGNLHDHCRLAWPWQRGAVTRYFLSSFLERPERPAKFEEAAPHLLLGVRDSWMFEALRLESSLKDMKAPPPSGFALGSRLWLAAFLDYPTSTSLISTSDLDDWGVSFEQCMEPALENLVARSKEGLVEVAEGIYHSPWQDCYDPARLYCPRILGPLRLKGDPVAIVPNWNQLIVTGSDDLEGLTASILYAGKIIDEEPRPISAMPIVRRGSAWVDFVLPKGHPVEPLLRKRRVLELDQIYRDQAALLEKVHEKEGADVYVARHNGSRHDKDDDHDSYSVWSKGVATLLPQTERVAFFDPDQPESREVIARVDWDIVRLLCGPLMKDAASSPPRFLVDSFPTAAQFEAMAAAQAVRASAD